MAGKIQNVRRNLSNGNFRVGDRVLFPADDDEMEGDYTQYVALKDACHLIRIPNDVSSEVAAMLPGQALKAFAAVSCVQFHVEKIRKVNFCVNVLIVGGGGQCLWTLQVAKYLMRNDRSKMKMFVADSSIDRLLAAKVHGCYDVIHWNEEDYEQYIFERTLDVCRDGVDVIIDFVSTHRSMQRCLDVLNRNGLVVVGGNVSPNTRIPLVFTTKQQSISGIPQGNTDQLMKLIDAVKDGKLKTPQYQVFPVSNAT